MKPGRFLGILSLTLLCFTFIPAINRPPADKLGNKPLQPAVPRFEAADCAVPVPEGEKDTVRCGYLVARENRTRNNDRTIRLPVIILKSSSKNPAPDPVLRTLGGPGASSLRMIRGRRSSPWLENRDVVIFEQRGTRYAEPKLECSEVDAARVANVKANVGTAEAVRREVSAAKACYDRLSKGGIDLSAYDSVQSAADIEDLRRVLGYKQWNLYGVSYSARLMLNVIRDHPAGVRSVVLESVLPPQVNYDEVGVDGAKRALDRFFAGCATDSKCAATHPNLEKTFYETARRFKKAPIEVSVKPGDSAETFQLKLNGDDLITWLLDYVLSADAEAVAAAPTQIGMIARGDYRPLNMYAGDKMATGHYMLGMRYSFWCREEMPFENRRMIAAQAQKYPDLRGYEIQPALLAVCDVWKVPAAKPRETQPVKSNIPTLILSAEYDAYTPPAWGQLTAKNLSRSFYFEVPGVGHGPGFSSSCARKMIADFLNNPSAPPDSACLKK